MHCDYEYPQIPTDAHSLYEITHYPYTWTLQHVSTKDQHPQGDINAKECKINTFSLYLRV
jgi:hypothetical protein